MSCVPNLIIKGTILHYLRIPVALSLYLSIVLLCRVPQGLLQLQVLDYSAELMAALRAGEHLDPGGEWEAEIRGCSIWAVEVRWAGPGSAP